MGWWADHRARAEHGQSLHEHRWLALDDIGSAYDDDSYQWALDAFGVADDHITAKAWRSTTAASAAAERAASEAWVAEHYPDDGTSWSTERDW